MSLLEYMLDCVFYIHTAYVVVLLACELVDMNEIEMMEKEWLNLLLVYTLA